MSGVEPPASYLRGAVDLSSLAAPAAPQQAQGTADSGGATVTSLILDGTDQNFAEFVELSKQVPVVVDLWAEWCQPCKQLTPVLEKLVAEFDGRFVLVKIDVDANPGLAQAFQAQSIPTVAALIGGRPLQLFVGALPEAQVRQVIEQVLQAAAQSGVSGTVSTGEALASEPEPEPLPPLHQEAYDAIERGDYAGAMTAYKTAIAQNPADTMAVAGLAQVSLLHRLQGKSLDQIRSRAASEPENVDAVLDVADLDLSGGHVDDAFDRLLTAFADANGDDRVRIRERLVELFEVVGNDDPRVNQARSRLANLLY